MVAKDYQKIKGTTTKAEVGEIDTSAPFQSVKDAVNLFGEGAFSGEKPAIRKAKPRSAERVLAKETQFHLAEKELNRLKGNLNNAESTKAQALLELERAKRTVIELSEKLRFVNGSKDLLIQETEEAKRQAKEFVDPKDGKSEVTDGSDLEAARVVYKDTISELDALKQERRSIHQEFNASVEAKKLASNQTVEAETAVKANMERCGELSKEIAMVQEAIHLAKLEAEQARELEAKISEDKGGQKNSYQARIEQSAEELRALEKDYDRELSMNLETQLVKTLSEIEAVRSMKNNAKSSDVDCSRTAALELDGAKESLQKVYEEENNLRTILDNLKSELDNMKKEHSMLKEKETETEAIVGNLHSKLQEAKYDLEAAIVEEAKARGASDEMMATFHQLVSERENAKNEAEVMKQQADELKREAELSRIELEEAENRLKIVLHDAELAKAAEDRALGEIKVLSEKTDAARASTSESGAQITISRDEFESLSRKVEEYDKLAAMKVAAATAQAQAIKASEGEGFMRLEAMHKEIEDMKTATREALKKAEMAEAAKKAVEGELRRWREREQKKTAEAAARILAEAESSVQASPQNYQNRVEMKQKEKMIETKRFEKSKTSFTKKVLMPSLTSVFPKKKNRIKGSSPSYLPGEKPGW